MKELESLGSAQTKKTYISHGGRKPIFGVTAGDLNKLIKEYKLKNNHKLALELYATGNYDAMYLAGLIADAKKITKDNFSLLTKFSRSNSVKIPIILRNILPLGVSVSILSVKELKA